MKKIISVICAILFSSTLFACATQAPGISFDVDKPWGVYEKSVYSVEIKERIQSDGQTVDGRTLADGTLTYELSQYSENGLEMIKLLMNYSAAYRDEDYVGNNRGLTDVIASEVKFVKDGCVPVYSSKQAEYAPRKNNKGEFTDTDSYKYIADYSTKKAVSYKGHTVDKTTGAIDMTDDGSAKYKEFKEFDLAASTTDVYDNEQLFYIVRALKSLSLSASASFSISNIYAVAESIDDKGKYSVTPFAVSVGAEPTPVKLGEGVFSDHSITAENDTVNCMKAVISLSTGLPGPAFTVYYTEPANIVTNNATQIQTCKIIAKIITVGYDLSSGKEDYNVIYTLKGYGTVVKQ